MWDPTKPFAPVRRTRCDMIVELGLQIWLMIVSRVV